MFLGIFSTGVLVPIALLCMAAVMMGIFFIWYRKKKSQVRLIPLQSESDDKVGRIKVQLSAIGKDDAGAEGTFSVILLLP